MSGNALDSFLAILGQPLAPIGPAEITIAMLAKAKGIGVAHAGKLLNEMVARGQATKRAALVNGKAGFAYRVV